MAARSKGARAAGCALVAEMDALLGAHEGAAGAQGRIEVTGKPAARRAAREKQQEQHQQDDDEPRAAPVAAAASAVGASVGDLTPCGCVDVATVYNLCSALALCAAEAAVASRPGFRSGSSLAESALALCAPLEGFLRERGAARRATDAAARALCAAGTAAPPQRTLADLKEDMAAFVANRKSFGGALSAMVSDTAREAAGVAAQLEQDDGGWSSAARAALARDLVRLYDCAGGAHCQRSFASDEARERHRKAECRFLPVSCPNLRCGAVVSRHAAAAHAAGCGLAVLPCTAGCGAKVLRRDMAQHLSGACPKRRVACFFAPFGCSEDVTHGTLDQHCTERQLQHLQMVAAHSRKQESDRLALAEKVLDVRAAHARALEARNREHDSLQRQAARLQSELQSTRAELATTRRTQDGIIDQLRQSIKQQKAMQVQLAQLAQR